MPSPHTGGLSVVLSRATSQTSSARSLLPAGIFLVLMVVRRFPPSLLRVVLTLFHLVSFFPTAPVASFAKNKAGREPE